MKSVSRGISGPSGSSQPPGQIPVHAHSFPSIHLFPHLPESKTLEFVLKFSVRNRVSRRVNVSFVDFNIVYMVSFIFFLYLLFLDVNLRKCKKKNSGVSFNDTLLNFCLWNCQIEKCKDTLSDISCQFSLNKE